MRQWAYNIFSKYEYVNFHGSEREYKAILKGKGTTPVVQMGLGWILPYWPLFNETNVEMALC